jgi:GT2 family glycosyltransferase
MVDNGSDDGSARYIEKYFPRVRIISNNVNNYAKANNLGIKAAKGAYIALINNDIRVDRYWLIHLIRCMQKDKTIGAVGSKILFLNGNIQSVGHQEVPDFYWSDVGFNEKDKKQYKETKDIASICGCSVLYRRKCLDDVGLLDEDFNMYLEDVDMCIRCRKNDWRVVSCPESIIYHKFHGTIKTEDNARYLQELNRLLLVAKYWPEKLADALAGKYYFTAKDSLWGKRDISEVLGKVFAKLIKEHGYQATEKLSVEVFKSIRRIYGFEKDYLIQVALCEQTKKDELRVELDKAKKDYVDLSHTLQSLSGQKDLQLKLLKEQKDEELTRLNQQHAQEVTLLKNHAEELAQQKDLQLKLLKEQKDEELSQRDYEISIKKQEVEMKSQYINEIENELKVKKERITVLEWEQNKLKNDLDHTTKELQAIYTSTGFKYLLRPLWSILWPLKQFFIGIAKREYLLIKEK